MGDRGHLWEEQVVGCFTDGQYVIADDVETRPSGLHNASHAG
jgi:hypothetical protein